MLDKDVITMSFAPKDEHEAQIQFALERGIPAFLSVIGTQRLAFPDNVFDLIHCARCRVHWDGDGICWTLVNLVISLYSLQNICYFYMIPLSMQVGNH